MTVLTPSDSDAPVRAWAIRRPRLTLLVTAALCLAAALLVRRLQFDPSLEPLFPRGDRATAALVHMLNDFGASDDLLVLVSVPTPAEDQNQRRPHPGPLPEGEGGRPPEATPAETTRLLEYAANLKDAIAHDAQAAPLVTAVNYRMGEVAMRFVQEVVGPAAIYYLEDSQIEPLKARLSTEGIREQVQRNEELITAPSPAAGAIAKNIARDPLRLYEFLGKPLSRMKPRGAAKDYGDAFFSTDGKSLLVRVKGARPSFDLDFTQRFMDAMRRTAQAAKPDGLTVEFAGGYAITEVSHRVIRRDMIENVVGSIIALQLLFLLVYRRPWHSLLMILPVGIGVLLGFGVFAIFAPRLTPLGAGIGSILAGIGVDYGVLFLSNYEARRALGMPPRRAADLGRIIGLDLAMACLTTLAAFVAIGFSQVPALRGFAILGGLALIGAVLATYFVLPAALTLLDRRQIGTAVRSARIRIEPFVAAISRKPNAFLIAGILVGVLPAAVLLAVGWPRSGSFDDDLTVMHPRPNQPLDVQRRISERFPGSIGSLAIHLQADSPEHLLILARKVDERLATPAVQRVGVQQTLGIASLLPDPAKIPLRRRQAAELDADRIIQDIRDALANSSFEPSAFEGYFTFLRNTFKGPPAPDVLTLVKYPGIAENFLPKVAFLPDAPPPTHALTLAMLKNDLSDRTQRDEAVDAVRTALADLPGATLTGLSVVTHDMEVSVRHDLPRLMILATVLVVIVLLLGTRRAIPSALAMIPPAIGAIYLLAAMVLGGIRFNLVNLVALPLLAGVGVDYGIFLVGTATRLAREPRKNHAMFLNQFTASGHAVAMCAATTLIGFGSLSFTHVAAMRSLGVILSASIMGTMVGCFFLLLPILCLQRRDADKVEET